MKSLEAISAVESPSAQELEDLPLPLAELHARALGQQHLPPAAALAELLDQLRDERAGERRLPCEDASQVDGKLPPIDVLEQITRRPGPQRVEEVGVVARNGEHDDCRLRQPLGDGPRGRDPAARHVDVEQADRRPLLQRELNRRIRARRLAAHLEAVAPRARRESPPASARGHRR